MFTRKFLPILVVIAVLAGLIGVAQTALAAPGDIVISYNLPTSQINPAQTFSVPVNINVIAGKNFFGGQFDLSWNPAVLDLVSVTNGTFIPNNCPAGVTPTFNNPTINHTAGTMVNYGYGALGLTTGQGCTGSGLLVTLNFRAVAVGSTAVTPANIIWASQTGAAFPAADGTFPAFTLYVGAAPRLVVQSVAFQPNGGTPPGTIFNAIVTVSNQGGNPSNPDTLVVAATNATPASSNVAVPALAAGASQQFTVALTLAAGQQTSVVTASIASFSTSASSTYSPVSSSGQTTVDATIGAYIRITPDSHINMPNPLLIGANNDQGGNINVQCNTNYNVDVSDSGNTAHPWHMTEWNGTAFVAGGRYLQDFFALRVDPAGTFVTGPNGGTLLSGTVAGQGAGDVGQNFPLRYRQTIHYSDPVLPAGETYHLVLTLNGYVTQ